MDRWNGVCRTISFVVGLLLMAQSVCAQTARPPRPYRSLFGGSKTTQQGLHALDLTFFLDGGFDKSNQVVVVPAEGTVSPAPEFQENYSAGTLLAYTRRGRRVTADAQGTTSVPYYSMFPGQPTTLAYGASGRLSVLSGKTTTGVTGSFFHSPYYSSVLDPSAGPGVTPGDYASALNPNNVVAAGASLTRRFRRSTSVSAGYGYDSTAFTQDSRTNRTQGVRGSLEHQLSRRATLTGGYGYRAAEYATEGVKTVSSSNDLDAGFRYTLQRSRERTSTFAVGVGSSWVDEFDRYYQGWRWSVHGDYSLGAKWVARADYGRNLNYYAGLQQPVWSDDVYASAAGHFGPRVTLTLGATYSNGQRVSLAGRGFDTYSLPARLQVGLAQWLAVTADYFYYRYNYPVGYDLPGGMPPRLDRQRVQIGASFWLPVFRAGRSGGSSASVKQ